MSHPDPTLPSRTPAEAAALDVLRQALERSGRCQKRVIAAGETHDPSEGLALLVSYTAIGDAGTRQAILDTVVGIADRCRAS